MSKINLDKIKADWEKAIDNMGTARERNVIGKLIKALLGLAGTDWKAVDVATTKPYDDVARDKEKMTIAVVFQRRKP